MIQDINDKTHVIETTDSLGKEDASYHGYAVAIGNFDGDNSPGEWFITIQVSTVYYIAVVTIWLT